MVATKPTLKQFTNITAYGLVFALMAIDILPVWYPGDAYFPGLAAQAALMALAAVYLIWSGVFHLRALVRSGFEIGLLILLAVALLSVLFSPEPRQGLPVLFSFVRYAFLFYLLADALRNRHVKSAVLDALLVLSGILLALAMLETYAAYLGWHAQGGSWQVLPPFPYRFTSLLMHANAMMSYLNLLAPLALLSFLHEKRFMGRLLRGVWLGFYLLAIPFSSSRGGWLGLATWAGILLLEWALRKRILQRALRLPHKWLAAAGVLLVALLAGGVFAGFHFVQAFAAHPTHGNNPFGGRASLWLQALRAWLKSPWVGVGAGRTGLEYFSVTPSIPPDYWAFHAHSLYLQVLSDFGVIGLIGFGVFLGFLLIQLFRILRTVEKGNFLPLAVCAGGAAWLVHSIFDDLTIWKAVMDQMVLLFACCFACRVDPTVVSLNGTARPMQWGRGSLNLLWLPLLLFCAWFSWSAWSVHPMQLAAQAAQRGEWGDALEHIQAARQRDPALRYYRDMAGVAGAWLWANEGGEDTLETAITALEPNAVEPSSLSLWVANLAVLQWQAGEMDMALYTMQSAEERAPREATYPFNLGVMLETAGQEQAALDAYCRALALRPEWWGHPFWQESPLRQRTASACAGVQEEDEAYWMGARQALQEGNLAEAQLNLARSDWAHEDDLARTITRGMLLEAQGQMEQALVVYEDALNRIGIARLEGTGQFAVSYASFFQRAALPFDLVPGYRQIHADVGQFALMQKLAALYHQQGEEGKQAWVEDLTLRAIEGELAGF